MSEIEVEIDSALSALGIGNWRKLAPEEGQEVCQSVERRFVAGNPRAWWLALKQPVECHPFPAGDGFRFVQQYVPAAEERCWFIPDTEDAADFPVYDALVSDLQRVLAECQSFEYYLVGKSLSWLVTETDHDAVIVAR